MDLHNYRKVDQAGWHSGNTDLQVACLNETHSGS